ncbi:(2Fe-2S)-binding protein [Sphingomonas caseinilyticus]|uniref:(2Fe-2S)-binding protein n=1 Tax=Sphingomonas caseinilyticus TaxID=2908205 RepID=UPI0034503D58
MIVCVCNAIREDEVRAEARKGATCPLEAYKALGFEPQCGCCLNCAQDIIDEERGVASRSKSSRVVIEFPRAA